GFLMPVSDQGIFHDRYMVIPRTLIFLTRNEKVLLLKGAPTKRLWANLYNGVGGHIEQGEDVRNAAYRELVEETGLKPDTLRLCGTVSVDTGENVGISIYVFRGECADGDPKPSAEGALEWVAFDEISELSLVEDLPQILPIVLAIQPGDAPFSARSFYDAKDKLQVVFAE
ncbi:MAG: NUDIX domain-containing protein, partial [Anaerolineales bacterium]|nr:NUDIX domain-containing protein [Anaerolineales bacterium]